MTIVFFNLKTEKYYIKQYEEETNLRCQIAAANGAPVQNRGARHHGLRRSNRRRKLAKRE